jgi:hypothetical protein
MKYLKLGCILNIPSEQDDRPKPIITDQCLDFRIWSETVKASCKKLRVQVISKLKGFPWWEWLVVHTWPTFLRSSSGGGIVRVVGVFKFPKHSQLREDPNRQSQ